MIAPRVLALLAVLFAGCSPSGRTPGRIPVRVAVGGQAQFVYLPTTLAERLGHYAAEGLDVTLQDFPGGAKALESLHGGSADVVSGFYDHTIQMAAEGRALKAFAVMLRYPGLVLAVSPKASKNIQRVEDLAGANVGVSAPGSSTHLFLRYLLASRGLAPDAASAIGVGMAAGSVASMEHGKVDAAVMTDPAIDRLRKRAGDLRILADTRTEKGVHDIFGTRMYPAAVLYAGSGWIDRNRETVARLARAMRRTLQWIQEHSPEQIAAAMPQEYRRDEPELYVEGLRQAMPMYSPDGVMSPDGPAAVRRALDVSLPKVRDAKIDLSATYTNEYVSAPVRVRVAIAAQSSMSQLPAYLAFHLGEFRREGLDVTLDEFPGGSKGLEALIGGSVDVLSGFYDQTVQMAAEGRRLVSFLMMTRSLMIAIVASPASKKRIARVEDLRGATVGVTTLGAPTHQFLNYVLARHGVASADVRPVAIGTTSRAVAAMERGLVDAGVVSDFTIRHLAKRFGAATILADTRTDRGLRDVYDAAVYPGGALIATEDWTRKHPDVARRLARAVRRAMDFLNANSPEAVAAKLPASLRGEDQAIYRASIAETVPMLAPRGVMPEGGPEIVLRVLSVSSEKVRKARIDLSKTYTNEFLPD